MCYYKKKQRGSEIMIKKAEILNDEIRTNMRGGQGDVKIRNVLTEAEMNGKGRLFGTITLEPGCSIGYHTHRGDSEIFYVLKGAPVYNDGGTEQQAAPGDVLICPDGTGHSLSNPTDETVVVMALIVYA